MARLRARRDRAARALQPTAVVHEVYLRLVNMGRLRLESRQHFLAIRPVPLTSGTCSSRLSSGLGGAALLPGIRGRLPQANSEHSRRRCVRGEHPDADIRRVVLEGDLKREYQEFLQAHNRDRPNSDGRSDRDAREIGQWARDHELPRFDDQVPCEPDATTRGRARGLSEDLVSQGRVRRERRHAGALGVHVSLTASAFGHHPPSTDHGAPLSCRRVGALHPVHNDESSCCAFARSAHGVR